MRNPQDLLREFVELSKKRVGTGVTPLEYQRWLDLGQQLERAFPNHPPLGQRGETRMLVEFKNRDRLAESVMMNVRPIGLFIDTPFAPESGTRLTLLVLVEDTGEVFRSRVVVVSNNVGPGFSTRSLGMGVRFSNSECELRAVLNELC